MKEFTIGSNDAGQRLDRFLAKAVPLLPASLAQKYIRLKRIKCNGKRIDRDTRLNAGDVLQLYINDEFFDKPREDKKTNFKHASRHRDGGRASAGICCHGKCGRLRHHRRLHMVFR